jgi:hypothetical protein
MKAGSTLIGGLLILRKNLSGSLAWNVVIEP